MSSDLRGGRTVSLTRWSNKARSFCRHLARVNASEPHTRSMMYPIPGSARSTTEVCDVCFQNMNTSLVVQNMFVIRSLLSVRLSALAVWDRFVGSQRSDLLCNRNCDWSVAPCPSRRGASPRLRPCRKRSDGCATMTSRCSTRRRCSATDGETYVSDPTRAPGESAVFY